MKKLISFFALFTLLAFSITSCDKNNDESTPTPKYYAEFGYFNANINGDSVNLKNKPKCLDKDKAVYFMIRSSDSFGSSSYAFQVYLNNNTTMGIELCPFKEGIQFAQYMPHFDILPVSMIDIKKDNKVYYPMKDPCKIQIDSIFYVQGATSDFLNQFVVGRLSGILYNKEDLKDSIIIKNGQFGVH